MKDDIECAFAPISPEATAKLRQCVIELWQEISARLLSANRTVGQEAPTAPGATTHLEHPPKGRPPVATFRELLFEKSARPAHVMPPGLRIGLLAASMLQDVAPAELNELVADIRRNLDWADAELRSVPVTTYTIKHWLQLEMAREQVAIFERFRPAESKRAASQNS
jgi:hypothetical protein